jgi:hypothetical protein
MICYRTFWKHKSIYRSNQLLYNLLNTPFMPELFSFFKNGIADKTPYRQYSIEQAVNLIKGGAAAAEIAVLRAATDPATQKVLKESLSYFAFSGTFKRCDTDGFIEHSGLICLDFDNVVDMAGVRRVLTDQPFVMACFVSPRGNGYKAVVRINPNLHEESFVALEWHFKTFKLDVDTRCIDVTRACYISHDPDTYFRPDAPAFILTDEVLAAAKVHLAPAKVNPSITESEFDKTKKNIEYIIDQIEEQGIDLTDDYRDWINLAFALSTLGSDGFDYFDRISQFNSGYNRRHTEYKFNSALKTRKRIQNPAFFFSMAKKAGLDIKLPKATTQQAVMVATPVEQPVMVVQLAEIPKQKGDYTLLNESHGEPIHLVTNEALIRELMQKEYPNILHSIRVFSDASASKLRAVSNNIRLVSRQPEQDFDLCDMMVNKRFALAVNLISDEYQSYQNYLQAYFGRHKGSEQEAQLLLDLCEHVSYFANALERDSISANIAKHFKKSKATILNEVNGFKKGREEQVQELEPDEDALPKWIDKDRFWRYGFDWKVDGMDGTGIYFNEYGKPKKLTNFVLTPLIHVYTKEETGNRRLTELQNGYLKTVIELPTKAFTIITSEGAFFTLDGFSKSHLNKLKAFYLGEYPKCYELNTLGWQPEGFFSFSNVIYKNQLIEYNAYGFAEVEGQNFLSMGASSALEGVRAEDDIYKNDKYLRFNQSEISFNRWCELMVKVFPDHGMIGITFALMSAFKDILFKRNNNFPMLYAYGSVGSGKSKFAESICNLFLHDKPMFNLNQGTDYGFFSELGMFRNVPVGLNEFDENAIKEEWFRALKGAFDGEGRKKGSGLRNKTKTQEIHAAVILIGQYLSTKDDNSVLSRTLPCKFSENNDRSPEAIANYDELKLQEKKGISSLLCDVLQHRQYMADNFTQRFVTVSSELKAAITRLGIQPKSRILENYSAALTTAKVIGEKLNLAFTYDAFFKYCVAEIQKLSGIMSESNSLSTFWKTVEFLLDQNFIENGWHYKVKTESEVRLSAGRDENGKMATKTHHFEEPKKLLYLRLSTIHALYAKEIRNVTGKVGQNEQTILTYMKDQKYYIGSNPAGLFSDGQGNSKNTSSYVFDYDMLGANLETFKEEKTEPEVTVEGQLYHDAELVDVIGTPMLKFTVWKDESYDDGGQRIKKEILTYCHCADTSLAGVMKKLRQVKLTGVLKVSRTGHRAMTVSTIELTETITPTEMPEGDAF